MSGRKKSFYEGKKLPRPHNIANEKKNTERQKEKSGITCAFTSSLYDRGIKLIAILINGPILLTTQQCIVIFRDSYFFLLLQTVTAKK